MTEVDIDVDLPCLMVSGELNIDVLSELQTEEKESLIAKLHQSSSSSSSYHDEECEVGEKKNKKKKNKSLKDNIKVYQNAPKFEPTSGDVSSEDKLVHVAVPEEHTFPLPLPVVATHNEEGEPKECN